MFYLPFFKNCVMGEAGYLWRTKPPVALTFAIIFSNQQWGFLRSSQLICQFTTTILTGISCNHASQSISQSAILKMFGTTLNVMRMESNYYNCFLRHFKFLSLFSFLFFFLKREWKKNKRRNKRVFFVRLLSSLFTACVDDSGGKYLNSFFLNIISCAN